MAIPVWLGRHRASTNRSAVKEVFEETGSRYNY